MSRVGKSPIVLKGAEVAVSGERITVKGPLGTISQGPVAFGAATWWPLHAVRHSASAASKAPIGKGVLTREVYCIESGESGCNPVNPRPNRRSFSAAQA